MLGDNIRTLRKRRGFSQEEVAVRLHVVRQTVSKWEKNLSVPDAEALAGLAEILEVPVGVLLGAESGAGPSGNDIAEQLSHINEQLAVRNRRARRVWTAIAAVLAVLIALQLLGLLLFRTVRKEPAHVEAYAEERYEKE